MPTPKELGVKVGNLVQFRQNDEAGDSTDILNAMIGAIPADWSRNIFLNAGLKTLGLVGKCVHIVKKNGGETFKFTRAGSEGDPYSYTIPVDGDDDCIENIVYEWT